ncbi:MAG: hypothetical protein ABI806_19470 [Candidatus Solibacter sp.]
MAKKQTPPKPRKKAAVASRPPRKTPAITDPAAKLRDLQAAYDQMLAAPDAKVAAELEKRAAELETLFGAIRDRAQEYNRGQAVISAGSKETTAAFRGLRGALARTAPAHQPVEEEGEEHDEAFFGLGHTPTIQSVTSAAEGITATPTPDFDLADFFRNVSRSVIDAQRELDRYSLQYARQQSQSPIPPALYSIPTVHAEVKAGLSKQDGSGILIRLFKDDSESNFTESTISFDIVASPPAPGGLKGFTAPVPPFLAVEGDDRTRIMAALDALPKNPPFTAGWQQRTVIVRDLDVSLLKLNRQVMLAFIFGTLPVPPAGASTDFSAVPLGVFRFTGAAAPLSIAANALAPELVRAFNAVAAWLQSITVP